MPYTIQGQQAAISTEPVLHEGKHYIPLREIISALGGSVDFDNTSKTSTAVIGPWTASIGEGQTSVDVEGNGQTVPVTLSAPALIHEGTMYVPFDFLRDAYGYQVDLSGGNLSIVNPNQPV